VLSYPLLVFADTLSGAIRGSGQALIPSIFTIVGMCGVRIVFIVVTMLFYNNIIVVFLSYPVCWLFTAIALVIYYFKGNWLNTNNGLKKADAIQNIMQQEMKEQEMLNSDTIQQEILQDISENVQKQEV
jgi:hypothetical protein